MRYLMPRCIYTWRDLMEVLQTLTPAQLDKPAQVAPPEPDETVAVELCPAIACGTIDDLFDEHQTRSNYDNKHHPDDFVLTMDHNIFAPDGSIGTDLMTGERVFPKD